MTPDQLDKWSKKRAEELFPSRDDEDNYDGDAWKHKEGFIAGVAAAREVYELVGRIEGVTWAAKFADENYWISPKQRESLYEEARRLEAQLAALLEGK